jgi:hypothetical protein
MTDAQKQQLSYLDSILTLVRAHNYLVSKCNVGFGNCELELIPAPPEVLSDLEAGPKSPLETPGDRAARVLDV